jgi:hypothetical protein
VFVISTWIFSGGPIIEGGTNDSDLDPSPSTSV